MEKIKKTLLESTVFQDHINKQLYDKYLEHYPDFNSGVFITIEDEKIGIDGTIDLKEITIYGMLDYTTTRDNVRATVNEIVFKTIEDTFGELQEYANSTIENNIEINFTID